MRGGVLSEVRDLGAEDYSAWSNSVAESVRREGFVAAWERHFFEILKVVRSGRLPEPLVRNTMYRWLLEDGEIRAHLATLEPAASRDLVDHLGGVEPPVAHELIVMEDIDEIREADGQPMQGVRGRSFRNWGRTVANRPALTLVPRTKVGVCNAVRWARDHGKRVRVAGYRHSWANVYGSDDEVLISLLPLSTVENLPHIQRPLDPSNELQGIQIVDTISVGGVQQALCRLGAGTTNEHLRRWCLDPHGGASQWTIPLNVVMVEITLAGSVSAMCHGAGWRHQTISDLVTEIEFVNANGELQVVNDPQLLRVAAGCFGLLGVVTAVTLRLDRMSYARMVPRKSRVALTIPPPAGFALRPEVDMTGITQADLDEAWADFVRRCENDYYTEWFWFPYHRQGWINTWNNDGDAGQSQDYPSPAQVVLEEAMAYLAELANQTLFKLLPGRTQAEIFATTAMLVLPERSDDNPLITSVSDALHFRRGIQNMRCRDLELEIPIPPRADDPTRPDWTICQRAWWAAINRVYRRPDAPMRITLEMRIMGGSDMALASQRGNLATCSIEVLSSLNVDRAAWRSFMQEVADDWRALTDGTGARLNVRPHWSKEWQELSFDGESAVAYFKRTCAAQIADLRTGLLAVAEVGGFNLAQVKARFGNPLLEDLLEEVFRTI